MPYFKVTYVLGATVRMGDGQAGAREIVCTREAESRQRLINTLRSEMSSHIYLEVVDDKEKTFLIRAGAIDCVEIDTLAG